MKIWIKEIIGGLSFGMICGFILFVLPIMLEI